MARLTMPFLWEVVFDFFLPSPGFLSGFKGVGLVVEPITLWLRSTASFFTDFMFSWDVRKDCLLSLDSTGFFFKLEMLMKGLSGEPVSNWILIAQGFSSSRFCMVWYRLRDTFFWALFFLLDVLSDFMFSWDVHLDLFFLNCLFFFFRNLLNALRFCLHLSVSATSESIFGCF